MKRDEMRDWLLSLDKGDRLPMWVISYNRAGTAPLLEKMRTWERTDDINVVVRNEQVKDYQGAYPNLTIHGLPASQIGNCGSARWGAADLAYAFGEDMVLMFDDDVLQLRWLFERPIMRGPNAGQPASGHCTKEDLEFVPDSEERVATGIGEVAREVFAAEPNTVVGGMLKQHMSFSPKNQETKYVVNGGVTPRQAMAWHLDRLYENGIRLDLEKFGVHGEDIGLMAEILAAGFDAFGMPSFVYEHWPESVNINMSMIRNAENAASLHAQEWEALQEYPIVDYLRVKRSILTGEYEWGDVDWVKLNKLRRTQTRRVLWPIDQDRADLL